VEQNICGNGVLEPANNEQCEKDGDCGIAPSGNKMQCEYCECKEVLCMSDKDCVDPVADDCFKAVCNTDTGKCEPAGKPYFTPCSTSKCITDEYCDVNGECKFGTPVVCDTPPAIAACYRDTGTCNAASGKCEYTFKDGATCAGDGDCPGGTCNSSSCTCEGGTQTCSCNTNDVSLSVASGCDNWPDATECSGWASVVISDQGWEYSEQTEQDALAYEVSSGTTLCFDTDCCVTMTCP
jgi:hypothetical protein